MKKCLSFKIKLRRKLWECCELLPGRVQMRWRREQKSHDEMSKDGTRGEEREWETKKRGDEKGRPNEMWKTRWEEKYRKRQNETRYRQGKKKRRVKRQHNSIWEEETLDKKEPKKDEMRRKDKEENWKWVKMRKEKKTDEKRKVEMRRQKKKWQ